MQPVATGELVAARELLACLQAFGEQGSNPVMSLLGEETRLVEMQKYPDPALPFGGGDWRCYYHYHPAPKAPTEHGHFHIFVRAAREGERQWAHLAGLGVDDHGLPQRWFAVNGWVTDDAWMPADWLEGRLADLDPTGEDELLPAWISAMLGLYHCELVGLLHERDACLERLGAGRPLAEALADRDIYQLAECPVALGARLAAVLEET